MRNWVRSFLRTEIPGNRTKRSQFTRYLGQESGVVSVSYGSRYAELLYISGPSEPPRPWKFGTIYRVRDHIYMRPYSQIADTELLFPMPKATYSGGISEAGLGVA